MAITKTYIRSAGNISPQHSLDTELFFSTRIETKDRFFKSVEPDYDQFVDSKMIRRMSRIVKMGVAAAKTCLFEAAVETPAAIVTATAYGCLEDSSSFLRRMIEFDEKLLSPTAFIQSTHNTVGAQIALLLKCHQYNNTVVHRCFSFENALTESMILLHEGAGPVLVGAVDEVTNDRQAILSRFGLYKKTENGAGNVAGEGAAFFLLDKEPGSGALAILEDVQTFYHPESTEAVEHAIGNFLNENGTAMDEIGLVLSSQTGNAEMDRADEILSKSLFRNKTCFPFKSLCGDYPTSSGFALWFASLLLSKQQSPSWMADLRFPLNKILIQHRSGKSHHSFFLISAL